MRIIAGKHRGRTIVSPSGRNVRPTSDRVRESLFNMLEHGDHGPGTASVMNDAIVLDVFAGSGAFGLEALSRGARNCIFMEQSRAVCSVLRQTITTFRETETCQILQADGTRPPPASEAVSLLFLDPPYRKGFLPVALTALLNQGWIDGQTLCCGEMDVRDSFETPQGFSILDDRSWAKTRIVLLQWTVNER